MDICQDFYFPTEVWLNIFDKMDFDTFLTAKLVCKTWYDILGHDQRYVKFRTLSFNGKYIHGNSESVKAIAYSPTKFHKIIIEDFHDGKVFGIDLKSDLHSFWFNLSKTVSEVLIDLIEYRYKNNEELMYQLWHNILPKFKRLEKLTILGFQHWIQKIMNRCGECNHKLNSLKILIFDISSYGSLPKINIENFLGMTPKLAELHYSDNDCNFNNIGLIAVELLDYVHSIFESQAILNKIETFTISICNEEAFDHELMIKLLRNNKVTHLNIYVQPKAAYLQEIYSFMDNFKHLKTCKFTFELIESLPILTARFITHLDISSYECSTQWLPNLSPLESFTILKTLEIHGPFADKCFFKHEKCNLTIENLSFFYCNITCSKCFETFLDSCKHLKSVKLYTETGMDLKHLNKLNQLAELSINLFDLNEQNIENLEGLKYCSTLTNLEMNVIHPFEFYSFMSAVQNLKFLKEVSLRVNDLTIAKCTFNIICESCPYLTSLDIADNLTKVGKRAPIFDINDFFRLPQTIKKLSVPEIIKICKRDCLSKISELFTKFRKLQIIRLLKTHTHFKRFVYEQSLPGSYDLTFDEDHETPDLNIFL